MVSLLIKTLIKNEYTEEKKRELYGVICGAVGVFLNLILFAGKFFAGILSGSIAITADAFNNLSDAGSSVISMAGFKLANRKPDRKHPYGTGRIEYISGIIISGLIFVMAYQLLTSSVSKIIHPEETELTIVIAGILIASILVKLYMAFYNNSIGRKLDSGTIKAVGADSLSDAIATGVVLLAALVGHFTSLKIDGFCGLVVSLLIFRAGFEAAKESISPLLGEEADPEFVESVKKAVLEFDEKIVGVHDLMVHDYGPGRMIISLHAEVPSDQDILELHDIIDNLENNLADEFNCISTIHMDPVVVNDPRVNELRSKLLDLIHEMDEEVHMHDFRTVIGDTHTNLIFDLEVPFRYKMTNDEVIDEVQKRVFEKFGKNYFIVAKVDNA